jgi:hypothetical protein
MFARTVGFTRWYDSVAELAQAVRLMEKVPATQQRAISQVILDSVDLHAVRYKHDPGLKKLGTEKIMGLMKSKTKRRWYDQDPVVHQAFNLLYMMDEIARREMGLKIIFSIKVMEEAQLKMRSHPMVGRQMDVNGLVKSVFSKNVDYLASRTVLASRSEQEPLPLALPVFHPEPEEMPESEPAREGSQIDYSEGGMKIIRLKKSQYRSLG